MIGPQALGGRQPDAPWSARPGTGPHPQGESPHRPKGCASFDHLSSRGQGFVPRRHWAAEGLAVNERRDKPRCSTATARARAKTVAVKSSGATSPSSRRRVCSPAESTTARRPRRAPADEQDRTVRRCSQASYASGSAGQSAVPDPSPPGPRPGPRYGVTGMLSHGIHAGASVAGRCTAPLTPLVEPSASIRRCPACHGTATSC